ncbi:hypothetical protein GEMRC1_007042 [Eukaryota sp. GEM-RC1]
MFSYFLSILANLPQQYETLDANRITIIHFCLFGVSTEASLSEILDRPPSELADTIYELQSPFGGFYPSWTVNSILLESFDPSLTNIAMTYSALASLTLLGDDLSRVNRVSLVTHLQLLQQHNGSVSCSVGSESDLRFVYCACITMHLTDTWTALNLDSMTDFILRCYNIDGGFSSVPNGESHAGSTFCAIASLYLLEKLHHLAEPQKRRSVRFLHLLQRQGFHGRISKEDDTCYTYWVLASLHLLSPETLPLIDLKTLEAFIDACTNTLKGGCKVIAKNPDIFPDPMHACLGLNGIRIASRCSDIDKAVFLI